VGRAAVFRGFQLGSQLGKAVVQGVDFFIAERLDIDQAIAGAVLGGQQLVVATVGRLD
jgi:hypothetical protein